MLFPEALLAGLIGLILGSLVTALSWRLPRGEPIALDRSRCPSCRHVLGPRDLVPVLSWLLAGGRCRYCAARLSLRYPLIEVVTSGLTVLIWAWAGAHPLVGAPLVLAMVGLMVVVVIGVEGKGRR
jgi:leader peptidase (prepilin peptidase)/N-methyltransferase